jgi:hypothetical protein
MPRSVLPVEDCVFRLDYRDGFRQAFPMTFENVGLSEDGFVFDGTGDIDIKFRQNISEGSIFFTLIMPEFDGSYHSVYDAGYHSGFPYGDMAYIDNDSNVLSIYLRNTSNTSTSKTFFHNLTPGLEYQFGYTWDGTEVRFYKNGVVYEIEPFSGILGRTNDGNIAKGGYNNGIFKMKKFEEFSRALTAQEVADRYNQSTFLFLNNTPTPTQQAYLDWQDSRIIGRSR